MTDRRATPQTARPGGRGTAYSHVAEGLEEAEGRRGLLGLKESPRIGAGTFEKSLDATWNAQSDARGPAGRMARL